MKAIFKTTIVNGQPQLPPFTALEGNQLYYEEAGVLKGGFSVVDEVQGLVWVESSKATLNAMKSDPSYEWIKDIQEGENNVR